MNDKSTYKKSVLEYARKDFTALNKSITVDEALKKIRNEGAGERIVYFYVVDDNDVLVGVLPTRRLLIGRPEQKIEEIMVSRVAALPHTSTVYDACEFFVTYKFLAFPVVDENRKVVGVVDVNLFTEELLSLDPDIEDRSQYNDVFETIGFNISEIKNASPIKAWKIRVPWLLATVTSGTICAILTGFFEATLSESIIIAFFLTLILGLGESISIQSMTLAAQALHTAKPTLKWYTKNLIKESKTSFLLGISCGVIVSIVIVVWKGSLLTAIAVGLSILLVMIVAAFWGLTIPAVLHKTKLDPKIAAGPITLALTDICTIVFYLGLATIIL
ncbi:MAG: magnesium transporter [Melioribacteraceae bacterium]|jgi:magnesium transporter|nr:magnesium transporter [Melioribacteraceae bacterium]RJP64045.1 MAG: magnesium transporter [Ignavibacteriales bacterium]